MNGIWEISENEVLRPENALAQRVIVKGLGVIRVSGADALKFLNALFTAKFQNNSSVQYAGWANPAGRLQMICRTVFAGSDCAYLILPSSLVKLISEKLKRYVFRSKVVLEVIQTDGIAAFIGTDLKSALEAEGSEMPDEPGTAAAVGTVTAVRAEDAGVLQRVLLIGGAAESRIGDASEAFWWLTEVQAGVPHVFAETAEKFTPQDVNLDLLGGVSFSKGCYPGQEVISRIHSRAKEVLRMRRAVIPSESAVCGADFTEENGHLARVAYAVKTGEKAEALLAG